MTLPVLADVVRSGYVEGHHHGSVIVLDGQGAVVFGLGELDRPVFPRSANKPLQAVGLLDHGWEPGDEEQVALAAASHGGEPAHLEVAARILAEAGVRVGALGCPPALPLHEPTAWALLAAGGGPAALQMNCSGKHGAMLAAAAARQEDLAGYLDPAHPVQQAVLQSVEGLAGERVRHVAVDGCGAPQHALTLRGLAHAFAALVTAPAGSNEHRVAAAMRHLPFLVAGTGRDTTALMAGVPGLLAKDGAEGVYAVALADGSAVALKIDDGAARARTPVLVAALRRLGVNEAVLDELATTPVLGGGQVVGEVRPSAELTRAASG